MSKRPGILFTAFERSGDEHAAPVIAELRRMAPDTPIYATGGRHMQEAGAELIEQTDHMGLMLADSAGEIPEHFRRLGRLKKWLADHPVAVHVPTDSPAANWDICKLVKRRYGKPAADRPAAKVVHLVAPQIWAWAQWRVGKLRKYSDLVLCLLPFEPAWFEKRGIRARFIGHPLFNHPIDQDAFNWQSIGYPAGSPKVALMPGSRPKELSRNWPIMFETWRTLCERYPDAQAVVAGVHEAALEKLRRITPELPENMKLVHSQTDTVINWADVVLAVSGTVSLHIARQSKPMALLYKVNAFTWYTVGQFLVKARTYTLPNLIAAGRVEGADKDKHVVREFIPFLGGSVQPIADELSRLIDDEQAHAAQVAALNGIVEQLSRHDAGRDAAEAIVGVMRSAQAV